MLFLVVASLLWFGSPEISQAQQSSTYQPLNFGQFRRVSSPLRPAMSAQESPGQLEQEKQEPAEVAPAEARPGRAGALEDIEEFLKLLEDYSERAPEASEEIKSLVDGAKLQLDKAREAFASAAAFDEQTRSAPAQIATLEQQLADDDFEVELKYNEQTPIAELPPLDQLQTYLVTKQDALQQAQTPFENLTAAELRQRISNIKTKATDTATKLAEIERQIETDPLSKDEQFIQARRWSLEAERLNLNASLQAGNSEIRFREATSHLPELQNAVSQKRAGELEEAIRITEDAINRISSQEINDLKLRSTQKKVSPPLQAIAQSNTELTRKLSTIVGEIKALDDAKDAIEKDTLRVNREEITTEQRIKVVGLSDSFGQMLQRNRAGLAGTQQRHVPINQRNEQIADSQIAIFRWEDELEKLSDIPEATSATVRLLVAQANTSLTPKSNEQLEEETRELLELRKDILTRLKQLENKKNRKLVALEVEQKQLTVACESYASLIDENILWVRSVPIASFDDARVISSVTENLVRPKRWNGVWDAIVSSFRNRFFLSTLMTLVAFAMLLFRGSVINSARLDGEKAIKRSCRDFSLTVTTYFRTAALAIAVLSPLVLVGWLLTNNFESTRFAVSLGKACYWTFLIGMPFEFLRQTCRMDGLAHSHFAWTERTRSVLWNNLTWFIPIGLPLIALLTWLPMLGADYSVAVESDVDATAIALLETPTSLDLSVAGADGGDPSDSALSSSFEFSGGNAWNRLGRIVLLGLLLVSLIFTFRTLHPKHGVLIDSRGTVFSQTVWRRIGYALFISAIVIPLVLMLMAIVGYYFSSIQIGRSLLKTIALVIGVAVVYSGAMRFLLVRRRHLRYEQLVHQRNQARLALEKKGGSDTTGNPPEMIEIDLQNDPGLDITDVSRQARELTNVIFLMISIVILWGIWQYLLPASKIMDDWELWPISLDGKIESVTLRDVLFSAMMFLVTYFGVRNIPGMLELILLQKLPIDAGARYAVTTIFRYILLVVGCIFALGYLKIPWANYSWLVAAISVGLGFGLQEIVANFVSGLILLLERPVRVGDVVTIDGTTGVVSRIQMRATTVTNWDNQELVVPNKELISGKLLNWTLSSVVNRIALKFGVAYGTDPERVQKIILDAIVSSRALLKEPPPVVTFEEFGDSSLNFTLRCCVSTIERRWIIVHDLNVAINRALTAENISIPFPQRDVHIIPPESGNQTDI